MTAMRFQTIALTLGIAMVLGLSAHAGDKDEAKQHREEGLAFFEKGQFERASYHLDKAYELDPDWRLLEHVAKTWIALEIYDKAGYALEAFLRKGGKQIPADKRAWAEGELERVSGLVEHQAAREDALSHFNRARELFDKGEYERAVIELEQAYEIDPSWEILEHIGKTEAALENYDRAIEAYEKCLAEAGDELSGARRRSIEREIGALTALLKHETNKVEARSHYEQGMSQFEEGRYDKALEFLELAHELDPSFRLLLPIGRANVKLERYTAAVQAFERYLREGGDRVDPERRVKLERRLEILRKRSGRIEARARFERGVELFEQERFEEALGEFRLAYAAMPNHEIIRAVARTEAELGYYDRAVVSYREYLDSGGSRISDDERSDVERRIERLVALGAGDRAGEDGDVDDGGSGGRVWTWIAGGVGLAAGIGAGITGGVAANEQRKIDDACPGGICPEGLLDGAREKDEKVAQLNTARNVLLGVAVAGVAAAVVLFFVEPTGDPDEAEVAVAPTVLGGGAGIFVRGSF